MGWEIEAEYPGPESDKLSKGASQSLSAAMGLQKGELYAKKDGSLDHGAEIVSHPGTFKYWMNYDFAVIAKMRFDGWRSYDTKTCGMHVHLSRAALSRRDIFRIMRFVRKNQEIVFHLSRRDDEGGQRSTKLDAFAKLSLGTDAQIVRTFRRHKGLTFSHDERYRAVNLENENTVEIRIFRGTLNVDGIKRNLALCYALTKFVRETTSKKLSAQNFSGWLLRKGEAYLGRAMKDELIRWVRKVFIPVDTGA